MSDALRNQLPENIQFGFDASSRTLVIAESENPRNKKCKNVMVFGLVEEILSTGMKLPVCFEFEYDDANKLWTGQVVLRKKKHEYDLEQVLALYKPIADKLFIQIGKTTPKEDRRQIIALAICEAVKEYTPAFGDFEKFITKRAKESLKIKNRHYVKYNMDKSMDASLNDDSNANFNLYSVNSFIDSGYLKAENRIMEEQFVQQLSKNEFDVLMLLKKRLTISEIAQKLEISEEKVKFFAKTVAMKRKQFFS
ncbi:MAG: transcriptional regulator [Clostridia bacterium]|nr:transcriptional regulator [Clostridia bacterium]